MSFPAELQQSSIRKNLRARRPGNVVLTESDVLGIRRLIAAGGLTLAEIGEKFGVDRSAVSHIKQGRIWGHVS